MPKLKFFKLNSLIKLFISFVAIFLLSFSCEILVNKLYVQHHNAKRLILSNEKLEDITGNLLKHETKRWYDADNPLQGAEFDGVLLNTTDSEITEWKISFSIPDEAYITDSWNGIYKVENGFVTVYPPADYNQTIQPHKEITFGFIMYAPEEYEPSNVAVTYYRPEHIKESLLYIILNTIKKLSLIAIIICTPFTLKIIDLQNKQHNDKKFIEQTLKIFANTIEAKDTYTHGHSYRVSVYAKEIAKRMGLSTEEQQNIYYISLLHDIGKIGIPDVILSKPSKLTDEEMALMKLHTVKGAEILSDFESLPGAAEIVLHHHERYDGKGYPNGISKEEIPLFSRIICIADCFDAMTSNRCYRKKLSNEVVIQELQNNASTQFDPNIVPYLLDMINEGIAPLKVK